MKPKLLIIVLLLTVLIYPPRVNASVVFEDNFDDGNDNGWIKMGDLPESWQVKDGKYGLSLNYGIADAIIDMNLHDYIQEMDMYPIQGIDKNIRMRYVGPPPGFTYNFHFIGTDLYPTNGPAVYYDIQNGPTKKYHIKAVAQGYRFQLYIDGNLVSDNISPFSSDVGKPGLTISSGGGTTEVYFDNIVIRTLDDDVKLDVPLIKQTDPLWKDILYDSADKWASGDTSIGRWGCALTSAAMVFKYNGINKMPNGLDLTPDTLNSWMKLQSDGYVREGWVNWLALARLSKIAKPQNSYTFDGLEYSRINHEDKNQLATNINNKLPGILEETGHVVVATGSDSAHNTFTINDPYYARDDLTSYGNTFLSMGTYTPSNTDLSYLMFVVDPTVNISLTDTFGNPLGEVYLQNTILDPLGLSLNKSNAIKILYFQKPSSGNYKIHVSSNSTQQYTLDEYLYDINANVKQGTFTGIVGNGNSDDFDIVFDKNDLSKSSVKAKVTFESLKQDIKTFYQNGAFKNKKIYEELMEKIKELQKNHEKREEREDHKEKLEKINEITKYIQKKLDKGITKFAADILLQELAILKNSL